MGYPKIISTEVNSTIHLDEMFELVTAELKRAAEKHGIERTPFNIRMTRENKLAILVEEIGEVAHDITYDAENIENLKKELVQVAAMALAWRFSEDWM